MNDEGSEAQFLGRFLVRCVDSIEFYMAADYLNPDYEWLGLMTCKLAATIGTSESSKLADGDEPLSSSDHRKYPGAMG